MLCNLNYVKTFKFRKNQKKMIYIKHHHLVDKVYI